MVDGAINGRLPFSKWLNRWANVTLVPFIKQFTTKRNGVFPYEFFSFVLDPKSPHHHPPCLSHFIRNTEQSPWTLLWHSRLKRAIRKKKILTLNFSVVCGIWGSKCVPFSSYQYQQAWRWCDEENSLVTVKHNTEEKQHNPHVVCSCLWNWKSWTRQDEKSCNIKLYSKRKQTRK